MSRPVKKVSFANNVKVMEYEANDTTHLPDWGMICRDRMRFLDKIKVVYEPILAQHLLSRILVIKTFK